MANKSLDEQKQLGQKAEELLATGQSLKQIAEKFKCSAQTVNNWRSVLKTGEPAHRTQIAKRKKSKAIVIERKKTRPRATSFEEFAKEHALPTNLPPGKSRDKIIIIETDNAESLVERILGR